MAIVSLEQRVARIENILGIERTRAREDKKNLASTESSHVATRNYTAGELLIVDNVLYNVTSNIPNGGAIIEGKNVTKTSLSKVIASLT
jgi:hypothetical protein